MQVASRISLVLLLVALSYAVPTGQRKSPPASPIDLNAATAAQLQQVPGIGPATAAAIVKMREKSGRFHRVEDLLAIHGISAAKLDKIRPYVYVAPSPPPK
jgi:competence protein ComEA